MPDPPRTVRFTHARAHLVKPAPALASPSAGPRVSAVPRPRRPRLTAWVATHKAATAVVALLVATAGAGVAAVVFGQSFTATPSTRSSPVVFAAGDDASSLDTMDFMDSPTISASGASASLTLYGIPGASSLALGEVLELQNVDTSDNMDYVVTLSVSGTPAATLTAFVITFDDGGTTRTWNLLTTPTLTAYTLGDGETWEFNVSSLVMAAAASGSQGALTISASMTPA